MTDAIITAAAGFLIAILWFDLMFDVQARHRGAKLQSDSPQTLPEPTLASTAAYYRRVTTTASPMGRLVILVMLALHGALIAQATTNQAPDWVSAVTIPLAVFATGLAAARTFRVARRLGTRADPPETQSALARSILRDHLLGLPAMTAVLALQIAAA